MNPPPCRPLRTALVLAACLAAAPAAAQVRFQAQPDTLFYEDRNPYHMYAVRGADTLGSPVRGFAIQREVWRDSAGVLVVDRATDEVQVRAETRSERARFDPRGTAQRPGGRAPEFSMHLRLPADGVLAAGRVWRDTVDQSQIRDDGSDYTYLLTHELRVERLVDTLGTRMAVVRGTGRLRYRQAARPDSAGGPSWWLDVEGPVDETFLFDVERGRIAARAWWMDLRGASGLPDGDGRADTVPAGLLSMDTTRLISAQRARLLSRALPAGDTSVTADARGEAHLHTVRRAGPAVESGLRSRDGTITTVQALHPAEGTARYALLHTVPYAEPLRRVVELRGDALHVSGDRDTTLALPAGPWAVSDEGMDEHLAVAVARMAAEGRREGEIAVLRPLTLRWDRARVQVIPLEDVYVVLVGTEPAGMRDETVALLVAKDGGLLYAEGLEPRVFTRRPPEGSPGEKRVDLLLEALRALGSQAP